MRSQAATGMPHLGLGPHAGDGEELFWAWRSQVSALFDIALPAPAAVHAFTAEMQAHHLGSCILVQLCASPLLLRRSPASIASTGTDQVLLLLTAAALHGDADGDPFRAGPGDVCVLDLSRPVSAEAPQGVAQTALVLPRAMLPAALQEKPSLHGLVLAGGSAAGVLLGRHLSALDDVVFHLHPDEAMGLAAVSAALLAACAGPALEVGVAVPVPGSATPAMLRAIRRFIEDHLADEDLGAETLVQRFGISRSVLYRMFETLGGVSRFVAGRRLAQAHRALCASGRGSGRLRVGEVADHWGFGSDTAFSRAFRRTYGISPRQLRTAAMAGQTKARQDMGRQASLSAWVRDLVG